MHDVCSTPDATPAFWTLTAFIAAVDIGDITSAMPTPISTNGRISPLYVVSIVIPENRNIATLRIASPTLIGQTGPKRSERRPEAGATTAITSVVGRNLTPASRAP